MLFLLALVSTEALAAWTTITVFDPPGQNLIIRSVGVAVDGSLSPDVEFFVADGYDDQDDQAALLYKYHAASFSSRYVLVDDFPTNDEAYYLPSITTQDGDDDLYLSLKYWNTTESQYNLRELVVDRDAPLTSPSPAEDTEIADDDDADKTNRSAIILDATDDALQACFTRENSSDDVFANHRDLTGSWQSTEDTVQSGAGKQEHCDVAILDGGGRVIAYQDGDDIKIRFESTVGTEDYTVNITNGSSNVFAYPTIAVRTISGTETVHVAAKDTDADSIKYRSCVPADAAECDDAGDWSANKTVEVGTSGNPKWPHLAVDEHGTVYAVYMDDISGVNDDRIRVSHLCSGGSAFANTDGGEVDGGIQGEGFSVSLTNVTGGGSRVYRTIAINDDADKVRVVYIRDDDAGDTDFNWEARTGATDLVSCS